MRQGSEYAITSEFEAPFEDAVERVKGAFKAEGFGTLTQIDVRATLKEKIGAEIEPYTILGVCNPGLASRAIEAEHEVGVLLPCNVLVHQCSGRIHVAAQSPAMFAEVTGNPALGPIAVEAEAGIRRALENLSSA